ncbi:MAG: 30S ribosomal protein S16 [Ignavibacteriae bacterium]|nr:30S ribosomal protein S16 [Ignavibacteriota bacterium]
MVKLRLKRMGKKNIPIYKIVAADARSPRDGRFIEAVGFYNPHTEPMTIELQEERILYWLKNGAQPTATVRSLFKREGLLMKIRLIKAKVTDERLSTEMQKFVDSKSTKADADKARKLRQKQNKDKKKEEKKEESKA